MPSASYTPPRAIADLDEGAAVLRAADRRFSASRRAVLDGLLQAEGPVSAEYLASGLGGRTTPCDLPSTYRNLELFERLGMVRHVHIGHGPGLYGLVGDEDRTYLVCERCERLSRLPAADAEALRASIAERTGFRVHFTHFPIVGLCARCAAAGVADQTAGAKPIGDPDDHDHDDAHVHEHTHDGETHSHPHDAHDHDHVDHSHEHSHGDRVHSHPHIHQDGLEGEHEHAHDD